MSLEAGAGAPLAQYAAWRRAGDFIFLSGIIPVNPLTGTIVNGFQDVPEPVRELLGRPANFRPMRNRARSSPRAGTSRRASAAPWRPREGR